MLAMITFLSFMGSLIVYIFDRTFFGQTDFAYKNFVCVPGNSSSGNILSDFKYSLC